MGWRSLLVALLGALLGCFSLAASAAPESFASDPLSLARDAIGPLPGSAAVGVWRDGKASFAGLRDGTPLPADEAAGERAALFEIGSISKVFTGVLLAQAVERGELSLDDTLGTLLAGKVAFGSDKVAAVTLRQLVTHTACMPRLPADFHAGSSMADMSDPYRDYDRARMWKALAAMRFDAAPPCEASYSNLGVGLLGELLSERDGKPWEVLVRERITGPLGMRDTVVTLGDKGPRLAPGFDGAKPASPWQMNAFVGAGGLRSTPADLLTFGRAILAGRNGPLGAAAERLVTPLARFDGEIGYAIFVRGPPSRRTYLHNGGTGGYRSQLLIAADTGEVLVVLASNAQAPVDRLGAELMASRYPVSPAVSAGGTAACLAECAGVYRIGKASAFTFVAQEGVLYAHATGRAFDALVPAGGDVFTLAADTRFTFTRDAAGRPRAVTVTSRGAELEGVRTDEPMPPRATVPEALAYVGRYALAPTANFDVQASRGQLLVKLAEQPRFAVYAVAGQPDRFAYDVVHAELQFERDASGKVIALVLHQNGAHRAPRAD